MTCSQNLSLSHLASCVLIVFWLWNITQHISLVSHKSCIRVAPIVSLTRRQCWLRFHTSFFEGHHCPMYSRYVSSLCPLYHLFLMRYAALGIGKLAGSSANQQMLIIFLLFLPKSMASRCKTEPLNKDQFTHSSPIGARWISLPSSVSPYVHLIYLSPVTDSICTTVGVIRNAIRGCDSWCGHLALPLRSFRADAVGYSTVSLYALTPSHRGLWYSASSTDNFLNLLILYTINTGLLTRYVRYAQVAMWLNPLRRPIASSPLGPLSPWVKRSSRTILVLIDTKYAIMPQNYIFMGIFLVLGKGMYQIMCWSYSVAHLVLFSLLQLSPCHLERTVTSSSTRVHTAKCSKERYCSFLISQRPGYFMLDYRRRHDQTLSSNGTPFLIRSKTLGLKMTSFNSRAPQSERSRLLRFLTCLRVSAERFSRTTYHIFALSWTFDIL